MTGMIWIIRIIMNKFYVAIVSGTTWQWLDKSSIRRPVKEKNHITRLVMMRTMTLSMMISIQGEKPHHHSPGCDNYVSCR